MHEFPLGESADCRGRTATARSCLLRYCSAGKQSQKEIFARATSVCAKGCTYVRENCSTAQLCLRNSSFLSQSGCLRSQGSSKSRTSVDNIEIGPAFRRRVERQNYPPKGMAENPLVAVGAGFSRDGVTGARLCSRTRHRSGRLLTEVPPGPFEISPQSWRTPRPTSHVLPAPDRVPTAS